MIGVRDGIKQKAMNKDEKKAFAELGEVLSYAIASHEAVMLSAERGVFVGKDMAVFKMMMMDLMAKYAAYEFRNMSADDSLTQNDD